ncbi:glutathione S-transferase family protein [Oryzicola mucosus]|uniref:Glutathione S-transferase N-terminal domain-containing protein n=1 Tax=Oryzicola mucosus TaxID=2767425 RepID=A0A8J6Q320_9HYPH|nr:glutathione S-transferase N-terminal domain-containing protein [Oryzicola mucosus]
MKLFYMPNTCSMGIHLLLEEIGKPYEKEKIDFASQQQYSETYKALNPKSKVPALQVDNGQVLTEWPAIAFYLARSNPEAKLLPDDALAQARVMELVDYITATVHMQGFTRFARPGNFSPDESTHEAVKARGLELFGNGFKIIAPQLKQPYALGDFTIADAALFYVEHWAVRRAGLTLPDACQRHYNTMLERPAVKRMLEREAAA